jgi:hypothetical protein
MSATRESVNMRDWTRAAGVEPTVRIGIVLDEDAMNELRLRMPNRAHTLGSDGGSPRRLPPHASLVVRRVGDVLAARVGEGPETTARVLRVICVAPLALTPGAGVLVHDVVAGRGFHWQKRIDQTLTGTISCGWANMASCSSTSCRWKTTWRASSPPR